MVVGGECSSVDPILSPFLGSCPFFSSRFRSPTVCTSQTLWLLLHSWPAWDLLPRRSAGFRSPVGPPLPAWPCTGEGSARHCRSGCSRPASQSPPPCPSRSSSPWPCWPAGWKGCPWRRSPWRRRSSHQTAEQSTRHCGSSWCPYETSAGCPTGGI